MTEKQIQGIKGWNEDDRPREKCLMHGVSSLSDAELLAILIGSGTRSKSAVDVGREILKLAGCRFTELSRMGFRELCSVDGIGQAKAVTLLAALEIGRRRSIEDVDVSVSIETSRQAADIFRPMLSDARYEEFWVMMLNHSNRCTGKVKVSGGGVHDTFVDPKRIFKEALDHLATGIVLCHNHPSGDVEPSEADKKLTKLIKAGANALGIRVLDHIIVGTDGYYSFSDSHILYHRGINRKKMVYIYTEKYTPRLKYIAEHIFKKILCSDVTFIRDIDKAQACTDPIICYSRSYVMQKALNICPHGLVFQDGIREQDVNVTDWNGTKIFFQSSTEGYDLPFDIFSASFYLMSRYEEYAGGKDSMGRFCKENSVAYKYGFLDRPIVDEWAYMLEEMLAAKTGYVPARKLDYRMHSSIIIDNMFKYRYNSIILSIGSLFKKLFTGDFKSFKHQLMVQLFIEEDPYDNVSRILRFHNHTNLNPTFFVMAKRGIGGTHNIYSTFRSLRKALRRNYTTGLHPSLGSNCDHKKMRKELAKLEKRIVKQRVTTNLFHELKFSLPVGYESLLKIGITDDYSMGYIDSIGFRAGTCTPFRFYDIKHEGKTRLMVHPLAVTDVALKNMGIHHSDIDTAVFPIVNRIKAVNGQFCAAISNRIFASSGKWYGWESPLEYVYKYASMLESHSIEEAQKLSK